MMKPADAERMSGYKVGRISPFGQIRNIGTAIEEQAMTSSTPNGGQRGLQVRLSPRDAARLLHAIVAPLMA
jgi:Cys-tRNA(Pro)/Cys-tRNA(Cys) deacylase